MALKRTLSADAGPAFAAAALGRTPRLARALDLAADEQHGLLLDAMVRLGRQTAYERMAHLLIELGRRLAVAGIGDGRRFPLPLTQEMLADALGLSVVHVNRTLQRLRREDLIGVREGMAVLLQPDALARIADCAPRPGARQSGDAPPPQALVASL